MNDSVACGGYKLANRRRFMMQVGYVGALGISLGDFFTRQAKAQADGKKIKATAQSIIHIFMPGGMAHQESFDPKPFAPVEYRGPMNSIDTKVPGCRINEALTQTAQIADKITICRSMTHGEAAHERGTHNMFTGYKPSPALALPEHGKRGVARVRPAQQSAAVRLRAVDADQLRRQRLSQFRLWTVQPWRRSGERRLPGADLALPGGVDAERFGKRQKLLDVVDGHFAKVEKSDAVGAMDSFYQRAYALISSPKAREAFNINAEDGKLRDAYGRNTAGQRMLMARRLVEAGVRFVSLSYGGWDFHANITASRPSLVRVRSGVRDADQGSRSARAARIRRS